MTLSIGPLVNHTGARGGLVLLAAIVAAGLVLLAVVSTAVRRLPAPPGSPLV